LKVCTVHNMIICNRFKTRNYLVFQKQTASCKTNFLLGMQKYAKCIFVPLMCLISVIYSNFVRMQLSFAHIWGNIIWCYFQFWIWDLNLYYKWKVTYFFSSFFFVFNSDKINYPKIKVLTVFLLSIKKSESREISGYYRNSIY